MSATILAFFEQLLNTTILSKKAIITNNQARISLENTTVHPTKVDDNTSRS